MSFGGFNDSRQPAPMAEINVTPMVDVMLVLLVIFILAAPLFTHAVRLDLPQANGLNRIGFVTEPQPGLTVPAPGSAPLQLKPALQPPAGK